MLGTMAFQDAESVNIEAGLIGTKTVAELNTAASDAREWTAETVTQTEAEQGTGTTRRAWTAERVRQAIAAWWAASAMKTKLDGIATGATANDTDAQLRDRSTHTGTQAISTVTGLQTVLDGKINASERGVSGGIPTLDEFARIPPSQLPSYVEDLARLAPAPSISGQFVWTASGWEAVSASNLTGLAEAMSNKLSTSGGSVSGKLTVDFNVGASPTYADGQIELRSTDGGDVSLGFHRSGYTACQLRHSNNGLILSGTSRTAAADLYVYGTITAASDVRLKRDIRVIDDATSRIRSLRGVTFTAISSGERLTGVIAQEVLSVLPEAVKLGEDGFYSVAYGSLVGLLIEALKEQAARIDKLESAHDAPQ
jgi:hypothetical protein